MLDIIQASDFSGEILRTDPGEITRRIAPEVGILVDRDLIDQEIRMKSTKATKLCDKLGRPISSIRSEAEERGTTLCYLIGQGAELTLLILETHFGEGNYFDSLQGSRIWVLSTIASTS